MTELPEYIQLRDEQVVPLVSDAPTWAQMEASLGSLMRFQRVLDRITLLRGINLVDLLQRVTPAAVQRKIAAKKALQTVRYLGRYNRACIAFWRRHGIQNLDFIADDPESLRLLPVMTPDFFYHYSPQDRLSLGDPARARMLISSGSTGSPKFYLMTHEQVVGTLPAMKQFLRANWQIERYDRVEIMVGVARSEPDQPAWGAGYNMTQLLSMIVQEYPHLVFTDIGLSPVDIAGHIRRAMQDAQGKTLIAVYTYAPNLIAVLNELKGSNQRIDVRPGVDFKFVLTGEAFSPHKVFQVGEWLGLVEPGLVERTVESIVSTTAGRAQLCALIRSFSIGFGAAELKTGFSGNAITMLWTVVMFLLQRNEPARVQPFLDRYMGGQPFPWSALKANPNVYFMLGNRGNTLGENNAPTLVSPPAGRRFGPAFATTLLGEVVNCQMDMMHIWDLDELAGLLKAETGLDIKRMAGRLGLSWDKGDMILTNGRLDGVGLDAAVGVTGLKIYGHHLQYAAAQVSELTGMFTAQNVDYADGHQALWIHLEAGKGQDAARLQQTVLERVIQGLESVNQEFREMRRVIMSTQGQDGFERQVQIRVLPFGHRRFKREPGEFKNRYVLRPVLMNTVFDLVHDPADL